MEGRPGIAPRFQFTFRHPLTADFTLSVDPTKGMDETVEEFLSRPEFAIIGRAPRDLPHVSLIRALRENARGEKWSPQVLPRLALILRQHQLLTTDEANWLTRAGPCWPNAGEVLPPAVE